MGQANRALTQGEEAQLAAYRRAADRLHTRVSPYVSHHFTARILRRDKADEASLIPENEFIFLLTAFRLIYAHGAPTNFHRVANLVYQVGDDEIKSLVVGFREDWRNAFNRSVFFTFHGEHFNPRTILDTWMNGEVFHQDPSLQRRVDLLRTYSTLPMLTLQWCVRDACFPALGLDNTAALVLGEKLKELPGLNVAS